MVFVRVSGRFATNIAVLTGSENIGNYNTHAIARVGINVDGSYREYEVPVITGNSLKHWHSVYLAEVYKTLGGNKLNEFCEKGIGLRGYDVNSTLSKASSAPNETEAVKDLCNDIHGFLIPDKQIKRDSLAKFSFASPVFSVDVLEATSRYAETHNRVDPRKGGGSTEMMIFKQEYSSAPLYGFNISLNLGYVCKPIYESSSSSCDEEEAKIRKKAAVLSILSLLTGFGSKQARALPIIDVKELLVAVSDSAIPNVVHGSYPDYVNKSLELMKAYALTGAQVEVLCYGVNCGSEDKNIKVEKFDSLRNLFDKLVSIVSK